MKDILARFSPFFLLVAACSAPAPVSAPTTAAPSGSASAAPSPPPTGLFDACKRAAYCKGALDPVHKVTCSIRVDGKERTATSSGFCGESYALGEIQDALCSEGATVTVTEWEAATRACKHDVDPCR